MEEEWNRDDPSLDWGEEKEGEEEEEEGEEEEEEEEEYDGDGMKSQTRKGHADYPKKSEFQFEFYA